MFKAYKYIKPRTALIALMLFISRIPAICQASTISYTYDPAGRLQNVRCSDGQALDFSYDFTGNLISYNAHGGGYPNSALLLLLNNLRQTNLYESILNK